MPTHTNEEIMESYQNLPKDIQDAILSVDTADIIREIGENHKLMIDKIGELADETGLVMLGFTHPSEFIPHLSERLDVDRMLAREIAEEINTKIFFPIRENLKKIHAMEETQLAEEMPSELKISPSEPIPETEIPQQTAPAPEPLTPPGLQEISPTPSIPEPAPSETPPTPEIIMPPPAETPVAPTPSPETPLMPEAPEITNVSVPMLEEDRLPGGQVETPVSPALTETAPTETPEPETDISGPGIFESKTKEEISRSPLQVSEKPVETDQPPKPETAVKKIDPYREPTS